MNRLHILLLSIFVAIHAYASVSDDEMQLAIERLDNALGMRYNYMQARQNHIDSLKAVYNKTLNISDLIAVGDSFSSFETDSAINIYDIAIVKATDPAQVITAKIKRSAIMPLTGYYEEAINDFNAVDTSLLSTNEKLIYHECGRRLYNYLASSTPTGSFSTSDFISKSLSHQFQLLTLLDKNSDEYLFNLGEFYFMAGDVPRAESLLHQLVEESDNKYLLARANHHLAEIAMQAGENNDYIIHLANSAIADIETATLEVTSLQEVGAALYRTGDVERSFRYLSTALDNAVKCGANLRMIESSRSLPLIAQAYSRQVATWRKFNYSIIIILITLLTGLTISFFLHRNEMKRLDSAQQRLRLANKSKDIYINQFLQLCSIYMDKLNRFCKLAERKISAGKADEFCRMVKSGKFIEQQSSEFYKVFDDAFLHLYPDFQARVNELLRTDCQIHLEEGERMNTDLRILAVRRMGIEDAASIAQILNYSLNTIYSYRNRLKSRAIDRDNFEKHIMDIPPFS